MNAQFLQSRARSISNHNRRKNTIAISSIDNVPCHAKVLRVWLKVERLRSEKGLYSRCPKNRIILFEASKLQLENSRRKKKEKLLSFKN